ncbi:MAG TPA: winged helix-turn-helix transcriptional regulator [Gemmatimonadales bacterium]|nr:winged helix-turn-helix transcriptional regulator [Gemmatimonadales bacterium]
MDSASANTKTDGAPLSGLGLGDTQQAVLLVLKHLGNATQSQVAREVPFAPATLREHLQALVASGLVQRQGSRHGKPGRPEVVYALTDRGEALFPNRSPQLLRELIGHLTERGYTRVLHRFFRDRVAVRRPAALARISGLAGSARVREVARILSEEGFMAQVGTSPQEPTLRLCHCPIRDVVSVTQLPCQFEQQLIAELLGRQVHRLEYIPDGDASCSYGDVAHSSEQESL